MSRGINLKSLSVGDTPYPPAGFYRLYKGDDGLLHLQDSTGAETTLGATGADGAAGHDAGYTYLYNSATGGGDPTTGKFSISNAGSHFNLSDTDNAGNALATVLTNWVGSNTNTVKGRIIITKEQVDTVLWIYEVTAVVLFTGYHRFQVNNLLSSGSLTNGDAVRIKFIYPGDKGDAGTTILSDLTTSDGTADPPAGSLGEYVEAQLNLGSAISLTTNVQIDACSVSLTPGEWDVNGVVGVRTFTGAVLTQFRGSVSNTSATMLATPQNTTMRYPASFTPGNGIAFSVPVPKIRFVVTSTTTIYLVVDAVFSGGSVSGYGRLSARRVA